jgi:lipopolysaccharide assembly outer membrane protein LptD (OstA)
MIIGKTKKTKKILVFLLSTAILAASCVLAAAAGNAVLEADSMNYDPKSRSVTAEGNVRFSSPDGEVSGDRGIGYTDGGTFEMEGSVKGRFAAHSMDITCDFIMLERDAGKRIITARGSVRLARDDGTIAADEIEWELESDNYSAKGSVSIDFGNYAVESGEASRGGNRFSARNVRRYEDRARRMIITAGEANGLIEKGDIVELIAEGGVVMNIAEVRGASTRITGNRGIFSRDRGTLVISGGAFASQEGRSVRAANIVYYLDSGRVEALGDRPSIAFETSD